MTERVAVVVYARDPISQAGVTAELRGRSELEVLSETEMDQADVAVVAASEVDDDTLRVIKAIQRSGNSRVVLVVARPEEGGAIPADQTAGYGRLDHSEATPEILPGAVVDVAQGDSTVPPVLLGRRLSREARLQRYVLTSRGFTFSGLTERELEVLKLVAEGMDTAEIAQELAYSERTIKNIIHDITSRFHLRNRSHAVAFALRQGLI